MLNIKGPLQKISSTERQHLAEKGKERIFNDI